jgi:uncharacterized membrane protein
MLGSRKQKKKRRGPIGFLLEFWRQLWRYFAAGVLVWLPLMVTVWITWFFTDKLILNLERWVRDFLSQQQDSEAIFFEYFYGLGVILALAIFVTTGLLARYFVGRRVIGFGERIVQRIPLVRRIYRAAKQIRDVFIGRNGAVFQQVCLIEYPRPGLIAMAFITSKEYGIVQKVTGKDLVAVFVPTTPNPTSGYLVYLHPQEVTALDITVEEAMKLIISGGAYIPGNDRDADGTPPLLTDVETKET